MESVSSMSPRTFGSGMVPFPVLIKTSRSPSHTLIRSLRQNLAPAIAPLRSGWCSWAHPGARAHRLMRGRPGASIGGVRLLAAVDKKYNRAITVESASCLERSSSSKASGDCEIMCSRRGPAMNAFTRSILKSIGMVTLITACLPVLLAHACGKRATRERSLSNPLGSGKFHFFGVNGG
jgi:hypothetical protein